MMANGIESGPGAAGRVGGKRWLPGIFLVACALGCSQGTFAADACKNARIGINLAGAEFGKNIPGREGVDYHFPTRKQIEYFASVGFNSIRLPIKWERLQAEAGGPLDERYLAGIVSVLNGAADLRMDVLIDLHNYARYRGELVGGETLPESMLFDVWQRIARALGSHKALYAYGLMNEPYNTKGLWHRAAQSAVDGIRSVDQTHRIYVAGEGFSNTRRWPTLNPGPFVRDPANLEVYEGHLYLDADFSGKYQAKDPVGDPATLAAERLEPFVQWLAKHGKEGAIGEYGVPSDDSRWFGGVDRIIEIARTHCLSTYYWAGGHWSPGYKLSLKPLNDIDRPLTRHFALILEKLEK